jgi:hypothetical protein
LIYAHDSGVEPRIFRIRNTEDEIVVATIDVTRSPGDVLDDLCLLTERIAREAQVADARPLAS